MEKFNFENDDKKKNKKDKNSRGKFKKEEEYLPISRYDYPLMHIRDQTTNKKEEILGYKQYLKLDEAFEIIQDIVSEVIKKKKCTESQAYILQTEFARLLMGMRELNSNGGHAIYFKNLTKGDYEVLNRSLLNILNSGLRFDDLYLNLSNGRDIKEQIGEFFDSVFFDAFEKDARICVGQRYEEFIHLFSLQSAIVFGFIISRDLKNEIKDNKSYFYVELDDIESIAISDLSSILSLLYPYNGSITTTNLYSAEQGFSKGHAEIKSLLSKEWKEKADWLNSELERIENSDSKLFTPKEKIVFEKVLYSISLEISSGGNSEEVESKREKFRQDILNAYFDAFYSLLSGDEDKYATKIEETKKALLKLIYAVECEKTLGKSNKKEE